MKILVIGNGGREHALAWKLAQSKNIQTVYVAPGNGGTALDKRLQNIPITHIPDLLEFAIKEQIAFTVVGPEAPLAMGIVDVFRQQGLSIFGPTQQAAQLESSKAFAKNFMSKYAIPTAEYGVFNAYDDAKAYVLKKGAPIVIKDDGLAAGKGVVVAMNMQQALDALDMMFSTGTKINLNNTQKCVVIEEYLEGEEASFIVMVDGKNILPLATSQDHKRLKDGDEGPNTGGMGAYSPAPVVTPQIHSKIMREIIEPTVKGMEKEGIPFTGFLYAGIMIDKNGQPKTLEFNCRMGDPETQPIMARLKTDLVEIFKASFTQELDKIELEWDRRYALGVVLAAHNYPDTPRANDIISGANIVHEDTENNNTFIFHAGTKYSEEEQALYTCGGRVLCVVGLSDTIKHAKKQTYEMLESIKFDGMQFRGDIGYRAIKT